VQPHIYLAYNKTEVEENPPRELLEEMFASGFSTDQMIYFKSKIKQAINKQFLQTLGMSAINCQDYY
jgi:hypothetical protein